MCEQITLRVLSIFGTAALRDQSEYVMAKRTKRATARNAKAPKKVPKKVSKKATSKAKTPKKQAAKRSLKSKAKQQKASAKSGRSDGKKSASKRRTTPSQQEPSQPEVMTVENQQTETTVVDVIQEPVPGVFVMTEFVETKAEPEPTDSPNCAVGPEPEEQFR